MEYAAHPICTNTPRKFVLAVGASLLFSTSIQAGDAIPVSQTGAALDCEIKTRTQARNLLRVDAVVNSDEATNGSYRLEISKYGKSGRSASLQSGRFSMPVAGEKRVSGSLFSLSSGDKYKIILVARSGESETRCEKMVHSAKPESDNVPSKDQPKELEL